MIENRSSDKESRNDEEDIDPDVAAGEPAESGVKQKHRNDGDRTEAIDMPQILAARLRAIRFHLGGTVHTSFPCHAWAR